MKSTIMNDSIPDWVKNQLMTKCRYCGSFIIDNDALTLRKCPNPKCPGHMSQKIDRLAKKLGIKNIGPSTALDMISYYEFKTHLDAIPIWFKEPPKAYIWQVGEYSMLNGIDKAWRDFARHATSMQHLFTLPNVPRVVLDNWLDLQEAEKYFSILPPLEGVAINVMMTGSIDGYTNRADFLNDLNAQFGEYAQLIDVGSRRTGVSYLIKEDYTVDHTKSDIAAAYNIPIITPKGLIEKLQAYRTYILGKENVQNENS